MAFLFFKGQPTDIATITHDLEWYGNSYRWPAYFIWAIMHNFPVEIPEGRFAYDQFLSGNYSGSIHFVAAVYSCIGVFFFWKVLKRLGLSFYMALCATLIFASSPFWLSNSFWNVKDFPVAVASLVLLYLSLSPATGSLNKSRKSKVLWWTCCAIVLSTILANKYAYFPLVFIYSWIASLSFVFRGSRSVVKRLCFLKVFAQASALSLILFFVSFLLAIPMVPQGFGDLRYPLDSVRYFLNHPLVLYDSKLSLEFLASRLSFLITPPLMVMVLIAGASIPLSFRYLLLNRRAHLSFSSLVVFLFFLLPFLSYVAPIISSGRVLYGQDLRHLIWLYPAFLVLLIVVIRYVLNSTYFRLNKILATAIAVAVAIHLCEVIIIYPHFYTYKGVMPVDLATDSGDKRLIVSHYFPGRTPELHASLIRRCFLDQTCKSILSSRDYLSSTHGDVSFFDSDIDLNEAYFEAYLRLKQNQVNGELYDSFGYSFEFKPNGNCLALKYGRLYPVPVFSDATICGLQQ